MERIPVDLQRLLAKTPKASAQWKTLTPVAQRDFLTWIESAKQEETRKRRLERVPDMLMSGKRRPCCYAVVPLSLYSAISKDPKAKARWKELTPDQKRDFSDWVSAAKTTELQKERAAKASTLVAAGKRISRGA